MAESKKNIKHRIATTKKTAKITSAMEMVSASKIRKFEEMTNHAREYIRNISQIIVDIPNDLENVYFQNREIKRVGYVIITSDKGLAGGHNSKIIKKLNHLIDESEHDNYIYVYGRQGYDQVMSDPKLNVRESNTGFSDSIDVNVARVVFNKVIEDYKNNEIQKLIVIGNQYINLLSQEVIEIDLLPINDEKIMHEYLHLPYDNEDTYVEVSANLKETEKAIEVFLVSAVFCMLAISKASEHAARKVAMQNATSNAKDVEKALTIYYNKVRQSAITTELSEIVAGTLN